MTTITYHDGILAAYRGEWIGEQLYRALATRAAGIQAVKLNTIADVERWTYSRLQPIADRLQIAVDDADWKPVVERRLAELSPLSWPNFIEKAWRDWPPYIVRFESLKSFAPPADAEAIQTLVDHEVALVDFVRIERSAMNADESLRRLRVFLEN